MARILIGNIKGPVGATGAIGPIGPIGPVGPQGPLAPLVNNGLATQAGVAALDAVMGKTLMDKYNQVNSDLANVPEHIKFGIGYVQCGSDAGDFTKYDHLGRMAKGKAGTTGAFDKIITDSDLSGKLNVEQGTGIKKLGWEPYPVSIPYLEIDDTRLYIPVMPSARFAIQRLIVDDNAAGNRGLKIIWCADGQNYENFISFDK